MTTPNTDLAEQIAQKLHEVDPISGHSPVWKKLNETDRDWYRTKAAALTPIADAAVKRGQAEAWDRGEAAGHYNTGPRWRNSNPYREETPDEQ